MTDRKCPSKEAVLAFAQGTLGSPQRETVAGHIEACADCQTQIETISLRGGIEQTLPPSNKLDTANSIDPTLLTPSANKKQTQSKSAPETAEYFGKYKIERTLGKGGMGAVYLGHDPDLDRRVAIKVPFLSETEKDEILDRFRREARAVAQITHPNICPIYEVSEVDGRPFLAMAFIEGKALSDFIKPGKPVSSSQTIKLIRALALGLQYAHERGVIHRDLKPDNIMIDDRKQPVIMDFGLARREGTEETQLTQAGQIMGTPAYMPPEQVAGDVDGMGPGCDIYSLGVIMYEMLTGQRPFSGNLMSVLKQISVDDPKPLTTLNSKLNGQLSDVCLKAMAKRPEDRYASMKHFADALTDYYQRENSKSKSQSKEAAASGVQMHSNPAELAAPPLPTPRVPAAKADETASNLPNSTAVARSTPKIEVRQRTVTQAVASSKGAGWKMGVIAAAACGGILFLLLGVVLFLQAKDGVIRIEVLDENTEVVVSSSGAIITSESEGKIEVTSDGTDKLKIKRGDFEFLTDDFEVKKGEETLVRVDFVKGKFEVVKDGASLPIHDAIAKNEKRLITSASAASAGDASGRSESSSRSALVFQDSNSYVDVPAIPIDTSKPFAIEAWCGPFELENEMRTNRTIMSLGSCNLQVYQDSEWQININTIVNNSPVGVVAGATRGVAIEPGSRTHLAGQWDGNQIQIFVNGKLASREVFKFGSDKTVKEIAHELLPPTDEVPLRIGKFFEPYNTEPHGHFGGQIDSVKISRGLQYEDSYNPAELTADENTIALYKFDEGSGDVLKDSSGNGLDGKIVGAKWNIDTEQFQQTSPANGLAFDTSESYVDVPDLSLDFTKPFCFEAWFDPRNHFGSKSFQRVVTDIGPFSLKVNHEEWLEALIVDHAEAATAAAGYMTYIPKTDMSTGRLHGAFQWTGEELNLFLNGRLANSSAVEHQLTEDRKTFMQRVASERAYDNFRLGQLSGLKETESSEGTLSSHIYSVRVSTGLRYTESFTPGKLTKDTQTKVLYEFQEGSGDVLKDSSGNNHHGKIVGAKWVGAKSMKNAADGPDKDAKSKQWTSLLDPSHWESLGPFKFADGELVTDSDPIGFAKSLNEYGDFELEFEWRISSGGNSGVYYRERRTDLSVKSASGTEYQLLDNDGHDNGKQSHVCTGSLFGIAGPDVDVTRPLGQYNSSRIVCRGTHVEHWMNGTMQVEYDTESDEFKKARDKVKHKEMRETVGALSKGRIYLQAFSGDIGFRVIRIRDLTSVKSESRQ